SVESIAISNTELSLTEGDTATLTATIAPENATDKTVTWTSSDEAVATVSAEGVVTAVKAGTATITVASSNGKIATCKVTVAAKIIEVTGITLSNTNLSLTEGETATLTATIAPENATDKSVTWTSSDASIATVSDKGVVTAVKTGTATITATSANGKTATCTVTVAANIISVESISISESELSLTEGETATLTATIAPENATDKSVTWSSSDEAVATVSADGVVTAIKAGTAIITAASSNGKTATCEVTVLPILVESLTIDPTTWSGVEGSEFTIKATVLPENAADKTVTFESSDTSIATVDAEGNVKVLKEGSCVITVSTVDGSDLKAECLITGLSGVETIFADPNALVDVYDMNGVMLKKGCSREELKQLKPTIYILRSADTVVKAVVNY
ncbi:MAG: Ig-like domain-containing protein, partial [Muribaculaceae bacterium]|nr:Ig-like domain-containing protein [Muribaculaceae bacterium]